MKKKDRNKTYRNNRKIYALLLMIIGVLLMSHMFYTWIYQDHVSKKEEVAFQEAMEQMSREDKEKQLQAIHRYEDTLDPKGGSIVDPFDIENYQGEIQVAKEEGAFGYLIIPKLKVHRPIYLGASEKHMLKGVAQVEGTSLPIGGKGRRSVIAGHRGAFKSGEMFLYLDKLEKGDRIYLYTLDQRLVYEMTDREVILPSENEKLLPEKDQDIITLLTCHPFPVNNKRLLVNCRRVEEVAAKEEPTMEEDVNSSPVEVTVARAKVRNHVLAGLFTLMLLILVVLLIREMRKPTRKKISKNGR